MSFNRSFAVLGVLMAIAVSAGAISASAGGEHHGAKLVGTWMVDVNRGPTLPPLKSLQSYTGGHNVIEIGNGGATVRSPSHGAWKKIRL